MILKYATLVCPSLAACQTNTSVPQPAQIAKVMVEAQNSFSEVSE
jgi:hypothetical protein